MEKEFVSFEIALKLKELRFDEECFKYYTNTGELYFSNLYGIHAPVFSQAFRFFREKYNMLANVYSNASGFCYEYSDTFGGTHRLDSGFDGPNDSGCWDSYEDAEIACLQKMIEIVKNTSI